MGYTDYETRKHWGSLDKKALNKWVDELEVDESEIVDTITSFAGFCFKLIKFPKNHENIVVNNLWFYVNF